MHLPQLFEMYQVGIAVAHENIELGDVLHLAARRFDNDLEIAHNLLVLSNNISRRDNASLSIAPRLSCQKEQASARHGDTMTEADRPRQRGRVNNLFFHFCDSSFE